MPVLTPVELFGCILLDYQISLQHNIFDASIQQYWNILPQFCAHPEKGQRKSEYNEIHHTVLGAICSSVVRAFAHGAIGRRIDPSWGGPFELFLVPASGPRLV